MALVELRGIQIDYEISGEGVPVVLLNGIMMTLQSWVYERRRLAEEFQCVLHDFRGQLRSGKPPGPYAMRDHVDDLEALLDHLEIESAHVVGTSYGGEVGMMFALAHPERVRSLSVIGCASHVEEPLRATVSRWRDAPPETLYDISAPDNFSSSFLTASFLELGKERLRTYPAEFFSAFADLCDAFLELDITDQLPAIRCPTLVLCGEKDALKPVHYSEIIANAISVATLKVIPGAGHAVVIEQPDVVNDALMGFLCG